MCSKIPKDQKVEHTGGLMNKRMNSLLMQFINFSIRLFGIQNFTIRYFNIRFFENTLLRKNTQKI